VKLCHLKDLIQIVDFLGSFFQEEGSTLIDILAEIDIEHLQAIRCRINTVPARCFLSEKLRLILRDCVEVAAMNLQSGPPSLMC